MYTLKINKNPLLMSVCFVQLKKTPTLSLSKILFVKDYATNFFLPIFLTVH